MNTGAIPDKVAPSMGTDKCRELKYSKTTSVLKHGRGNVNFAREARSTPVRLRNSLRSMAVLSSRAHERRRAAKPREK